MAEYDVTSQAQEAQGQAQEEASPTKPDFMESAVAYLSKMGGGVCVVVVPPTGLTLDESGQEGQAEGQDGGEKVAKAKQDTFYVAMNFRPDLELSEQVLHGIMGEIGNHVQAELRVRGYMPQDPTQETPNA